MAERRPTDAIYGDVQGQIYTYFFKVTRMAEADGYKLKNRMDIIYSLSP